MDPSTSRAYLRFSILWLTAGILSGIIASLDLVNPEFLQTQPALLYGRISAAHRAIIVHGFLFSTLFAVCYWLIPKLTRSIPSKNLFSTPIAWFGNLVVAVGVVFIFTGLGSGQRFTDIPVALAFIFWIYLILAAIDIGRILIKSDTRIEHPSIVLLIPAALIPAVAYPFTMPGWWGFGIFAALRIWTSWRVIFSMSFLLAAFAVIIWILHANSSKLKNLRGIFTYSILIFAAFSPFMGILHIMDYPFTAALKAWGVFSTVLACGAILLLIRLLWKNSDGSLPSNLAIAGMIGIGVSAVQIFAYTMPPVTSLAFYTSLAQAHAHFVLGAIAVVLLGSFTATASRGHTKSHRSIRSLSIGFTLLIIGILGVFVSGNASGITQAVAFSRNLSIPDWMPVFRWMHIMMLVAGIFAFAGSILLFSGFQSIMKSTTNEIAAAGSSKDEGLHPVELPGTGNNLDKRENIFPSTVSGSAVFGIVCVAFLAAMLIAGYTNRLDLYYKPDPSTTPEIMPGRKIFNGENCISCHTEMVRPADRGMGSASTPSSLRSLMGIAGTSRIGSDLSNVDGKYPDSLLAKILIDPSSVQPGTVMPSYSHLSDSEIDALVDYLNRPDNDLTGWEVVRAKNQIEDIVPDSILSDLSDYLDTETGTFDYPVSYTDTAITAGRGLYLEHCAACHGVGGSGDGPMWISGYESFEHPADGPVVLNFPDFHSESFRTKSYPMIYWQVTEGIPGSGMPGWGGKLSDESIWLTILYTKWLSEQNTWEIYE
jgi:mono/diheme cytochrome c family protein/cbb3-type cytochrome oxidase subunit 1